MVSEVEPCACRPPLSLDFAQDEAASGLTSE